MLRWTQPQKILFIHFANSFVYVDNMASSGCLPAELASAPVSSLGVVSDGVDVAETHPVWDWAVLADFLRVLELEGKVSDCSHCV